MTPRGDAKGVIEYAASWGERIESRLSELLRLEGSCPATLAEAMSYSVFSGGKRLRPVMVIAAAEAVGADPRSVPGLIDAACAVEIIHTYSLVHDDLPCMDDDDLRRGKPTSHKVFGEAVAVLAGDALLTYAFEVLAGSGAPAGRVVAATRVMARCAGPAGMVGGQVIDIELESGGERAADEATQGDVVRRMHVLKTSNLFSGSVTVGGILAGGNEEQVAALQRYAIHFGLGFQIADDVKDAESGQDAGKVTYVSLYGTAAARAEALGALSSAARELDILGGGAWALREIAHHVAAGIAEGVGQA
ncbi:MAG: polyprenyl synthetase family protein [Firmicutes bacterium]|nr:polyprenyl synthetase family protein [Bacillota bacterium]